MTVSSFLSGLETERKKLLTAIHHIIVDGDKSVVGEVGLMMGKEMILYKAKGIFKYGLSGVKAYMSLHAMPIYGDSKLHAKYEQLLNKARFQKGCINFKNAEEMPLDIVKQFIQDCAKIDLAAMMEDFKKNRGKSSS